MKKITKAGHQGDLNFHPVNEVPQGFTPVDAKEYDTQRGGFTLALGEHSGHAHTIVAERDDTRFKLYKNDKGEHCLEVFEPITLMHGTFVAPGKIKEDEVDKHQTVILEPQIYVQKIEEGYDPFLKIARQVAD